MRSCARVNRYRGAEVDEGWLKSFLKAHGTHLFCSTVSGMFELSTGSLYSGSPEDPPLFRLLLGVSEDSSEDRK